MLLIKKKSKKRTFIDADIKDETEGIKDYTEQFKELIEQGDVIDAKKIRHILGQEKQHKKILVGIKQTKKNAVMMDNRLLIRK